MADGGSLWHTVKKLIEIRGNYKALQSRGKIEFLEWGYPLVYRRSTMGQSLLIIINTKAESVSVKYSGKIVHTVGGTAAIENGVCTLDGCTAVIIEE